MNRFFYDFWPVILGSVIGWYMGDCLGLLIVYYVEMVK